MVFDPGQQGSTKGRWSPAALRDWALAQAQRWRERGRAAAERTWESGRYRSCQALKKGGVGGGRRPGAWLQACNRCGDGRAAWGRGATAHRLPLRFKARATTGKRLGRAYTAPGHLREEEGGSSSAATPTTPSPPQPTKSFAASSCAPSYVPVCGRR